MRKALLAVLAIILSGCQVLRGGDQRRPVNFFRPAVEHGSFGKFWSKSS